MSGADIPVPSSTSLYQLETALISLAEEAEQAQGLTPEIESGLDTFLRAVVEKRDRVAQFLRWCESQSEFAQAEQERLRARQKFFDQTVERIENYILFVMEELDTKRLEGRTAAFVRCKNPPGVDVKDVRRIPRQYLRLIVSIPADLWDELEKCAPPELLDRLLHQARLQDTEAMRTPIREALERGEIIEGAAMQQKSRVEVR